MNEEQLDKKAGDYAIHTYENCTYDNFPYHNDSRARKVAFKDGYMTAVREYVHGTLYKNTIVLKDQDSDESQAVIITNEEPSTIRNIIEEVKDSLPGEWQYEDLIEGLNKKGIKFRIDEDITVINY